MPVFHRGEVVAYIQAFGHHDDIGGRVPGSMPGTAATVFEEGLAVPPIKLYSAGVRNEAVFTIVKRNTRVPDMLAADLDSEVQACLMGARRMAELFERFGRETVEACFQAILDKCRDIFRRELLPKIADGEYRWEDYVEHDGVTDPKLHKLALKMIKRGDRITLDFTGTDPQSTGPINWPADYAGGAFLIKWIAPILRNLADTPERAAEIHVNEGVCEVFDVIFPPKGTLITPEWPAATNARSFVLLRCLGLLAGVVAQAVDGRMPADQETIRYTGFYGTDAERQAVPLARGAGRRLGRALLTPTATTPSISCRIRATSRPNSPRRDFRCWSRSSRCARTRAAPASGAAGLGYEKHYRALVDCRTIVTADRVRLGCYGVNGGKAGAPFCVTVDVGGDDARSRRPRRRRAGAGRADRARRHHRRRRLGRSARARAGAGAARCDRGQGVGGSGARRLRCRADAGAAGRLHDRRRRRPRACGQARAGARKERPMIDRGDGYEKMLRGEVVPWTRSA